MKSHYSIYEAKAKLSEIIRAVKSNRQVIITERGKEVACVAPLRPANTLAQRIEELERRGVVSPAVGSVRDIKPIARRPGALRRFLRDR